MQNYGNFQARIQLLFTNNGEGFATFHATFPAEIIKADLKHWKS